MTIFVFVPMMSSGHTYMIHVGAKLIMVNCMYMASLDHFWDVEGKYLARQSRAFSTFNRIVGRPEPKDQSSMGDSWLSGYRSNPQRQIEAESKKFIVLKSNHVPSVLYNS
jgi:hypothetical protein